MKNRNELAQKAAMDIIGQISQSALENNLSIPALAQISGISTSQVYRIMSGQTQPTLDSVVLLSLAAGCTVITISDLNRLT